MQRFEETSPTITPKEAGFLIAAPMFPPITRGDSAWTFDDTDLV
jgi:hypothetical protein